MAVITGTTTYPIGVNTWIRDCADLQGCKITINSAVTYNCNYCGDIALYYLNKYGGWNSFLIEGNCKRTDALTEHTYNKSVNNTTINFENNRYAVEILPTWELHTGWLNDEESERLASDLIPTTKLYIHNLKTDEIKPAVITDTSVTYSTFRNNGHKLISYTINVAESQTKIRR